MLLSSQLSVHLTFISAATISAVYCDPQNQDSKALPKFTGSENREFKFIPFNTPSTSGGLSTYNFGGASPSWSDFVKVLKAFGGSENVIALAPKPEEVALSFQSDLANNERRKDLFEDGIYFESTPDDLSRGAKFNHDKQLQDNSIVQQTLVPSPVILVPGFGGSRLQARLDKTKSAHYFCDQKSDWFDVWINLKLLLPYMIDCFVDDVRLEFDYYTNTTKSPAGVEVRVKNDSGLHSVEYLHPISISGFAYMGPIVEKLIDSGLGFQREQNILGAPYDFRKAPNELQDYFIMLRNKTQCLYEANKFKPVTFICHSMGCNNMLYFLQRQSQGWKDRHVKRLVSIAAPWAGSLGALKAAASGDNLGLPFLLSESKLNKIQRSLPSTMYLFPNKKLFASTPLITSHANPFYAASANETATTFSLPLPSPLSLLGGGSKQESVNNKKDDQQQIAADDLEKNAALNPKPKHYSASNLDEFFEDIDHRDGYYMWLNTHQLLGDLEAPGVELHCLVGINHKTLGRIEYMGAFPRSDYIEYFEDGDGTVSLASASYCKRWTTKQKQPVIYKQFDMNHIESLKSTQVIEYIERMMWQSP